MPRSAAYLMLLLGCALPGRARGQEEPADPPQAAGEDPAHEELRALRRSLVAALEKGDVEAQLVHVDDQIVTTWQNNRVVRGRDGLRQFLGEISNGNKKVFRGYKVPPEVDDLTILYGGDTGVAFGRSVPQYNYMGMEFDLENRWTATLIKDDGQWKIAAYHVSANVLDNPVLGIAKRSAYWAGGLGLAGGLVLGGVLTALVRRNRKPGA